MGSRAKTIKVGGVRLADWNRECETRSEAEGEVCFLLCIGPAWDCKLLIRVVVGFRMWMLAKRGARGGWTTGLWLP